LDLIASRPIAEVGELDRDRLYLFVAGAGHGEGIALACPGRGWVLVDGCGTRRPKRRPPEFPLLQIYQRWSSDDDPVLAMILTHPHEDHVEGLPQLIELLAPAHIVVTKPLSEVQAGRIFASEATLWRQIYQAPEYETAQRASLVANALQGIETYHEDYPEKVLGACCDYQLPFLPDGVQGWVRAPTADDITRIMSRVKTRQQYLDIANEISIVLEFRFGSTRLVLGGDLPTTRQRVEVPSGWNAVMARSAHLGQHIGLKVPHHGSVEATHPELMQSNGGPRAWCLTPFNSYHKLPKPEPNDGLDFMLERERSVLLSALPASRDLQACWPHPAVVPLNEFHERTRFAATGDSYLDNGEEVTASSAVGPLDPLWVCSFDDAGHVVGRWRGDAAVEVVRVNPVAPATALC